MPKTEVVQGKYQVSKDLSYKMFLHLNTEVKLC